MDVSDLFFSQPRLATWAWDVDQDRVRWSPPLRSMLDYGVEKPAPSWAEHRNLLTPSSCVRLGRAVERCLQTGEAYCLRVDFIGPLGKLVHVENHGSVVGWEDVRPVRLAENDRRDP